MPGGLSSTLCYHRIRRGGRLRLIASDPPALFCHIWSPFRRRLMILGLVNKMGPLLQTYWAHSLAGMWGAHQSFLHPPPTQWGRDEIRELYFWEPSPSLMCETATDKGLRRNRAIETSWSVCRVRDKGSLLNGLRSKLFTQISTCSEYFKWFSANHFFGNHSSNLKNFGDTGEKHTQRKLFPNCLLPSGRREYVKLTEIW